jgi:ABC-type Zn2+ transport system substrate-binding protein/surface adhesin
MINFKHNLNRILSLSVASLFLIVLTTSFFVSIQSLSNESSLSEGHNIFLVSHLDYYHNLNQHEDSEDTKDMDHHSHTHKHSENGEEHSHEHLNSVAFPNLLLSRSDILKMHSSDLKNTITNSYNPIMSDSSVLKVLRPPIFS